MVEFFGAILVCNNIAHKLRFAPMLHVILYLIEICMFAALVAITKILSRCKSISNMGALRVRGKDAGYRGPQDLRLLEKICAGLGTVST